MRRVAMLLCVFLLLPSLALAQAKDPVKLKVGMVAAVDMLALPIAVERGFFEKYGLDVTIARPYATGVDALNALQAGETDMVQAGVPAIGASLAEIKTRFGTLIRDRQHNAYYNSTRPLNDGSGQSVYQTLGYFIDKSAHVRGIALSQMTTD